MTLGAPSGTALTSMCIAISITIEYIWHTEEQSEYRNLRLTMTENEVSRLSSLENGADGAEFKYDD